MTHQELTYSSEGRPANRFRQQDSDMDSMIVGETLPYNLFDSYQSLTQLGSFGKMSLVYYPMTKDEHSYNSPITFLNSGMGGATGCLTLSTRESPNHAAESTLSDIMIGDVQPKYYLSQKCRNGLITRNKKHKNKVIPRLLLRALLMCITTLSKGI